jgi:hypothetical protein
VSRCGTCGAWRDALQCVGDRHDRRCGTVLLGGRHHAERDVDINAGACGIMNQQYRTSLAWGAL